MRIEITQILTVLCSHLLGMHMGVLRFPRNIEKSRKKKKRERGGRKRERGEEEDGEDKEREMREEEGRRRIQISEENGR